jgi:hypothetical protein
MLSVNVLLTFARMSVRIHRTVIQGLGTRPMMNGHPLTRNVSVESAAKAPPTFTRAFVEMIWTCPPCGHIRIAFTLRVFPATLRNLPCAVVNLHRG